MGAAHTAEVRLERTYAIVLQQNNRNTSDFCGMSTEYTPISLLFSLSKLALLDFITTWLPLRDVCRLDAAVSDDAFREYWLTCLKECTFYGSTDQYDQFNKSAIGWISARDVSVLHMVCRIVDICFEERRALDKEDVDNECMDSLPKSLVSLSLSGCIYIEAAGVSTVLGRCEHLRSLILDGLRLDASVLLSITRHGSNLSHLSLAWVHWRLGLDNHVLLSAAILSCRLLNSVDVRMRSTSDAEPALDIEQIARSFGEQLLHLKTSYFSFDPGTLSAITQNCPSLDTLWFREDEDLPDGAMEQIIVRGSNIRHLGLGCDGISGDWFRQIGICCPTLKSLAISIYRNRLLNRPNGIIDMLKNLHSLTDLRIASGTAMMDETLEIIAGYLPNLVALYLGECIITGEALARCMDTYWVNLRHLTLHRCFRITDDSYRTLAENWTRLETLNIGQSRIGDHGVLAIHKHCKKLKTLYFSSDHCMSDKMHTQVFQLFAGIVLAPTGYIFLDFE